MIVRALVADLMDRSRISAAAPGVQFVRSADELAGADLALVDLQRVDPAAVPPGVRTIGYASHVDRATIGTAAAAGIEAMPRSEFFRRIGDLLQPPDEALDQDRQSSG